jgi:hypothetical protein
MSLPLILSPSRVGILPINRSCISSRHYILPESMFSGDLAFGILSSMHLIIANFMMANTLAELASDWKLLLLM